MLFDKGVPKQESCGHAGDIFLTEVTRILKEFFYFGVVII